MRKQQTVRTASGSALVIALLILLAMTIVGVATLASVNMQERMAGNANLQSLAFESASAGLSEALSWAFGTPYVGETWGDCNRADGLWRGRQSPARAVDLHQGAVQTVDLQFTLKNDCLEDPVYAEVVAVDPTFLPPVQFFVTSEGTVSTGNTPLARREIEVLIDNVRGDGLSALRVEGQAAVNFDAANSNSFVVDGGGGPAISTSSLANASLITNDIVDKDRIGNYGGGIVQSTYPPPFNEAEPLAQFSLRMKAYMEFFGIGSADESVATDCPGPFPFDSTMRLVNGDLSIGNGSVQGITYVTGNFSAGGNASGSGLLIVEGAIDTNGTPDFDGMIIALGGAVDMSGGGRGVTNGMVFMTNLDLGAEDDPAKVNYRYREIIEPFRVSGATGAWFPDVYDKIMGLADFDIDGTIKTLDYRGVLDIDETASPPKDGFGSSTVSFAGGGNHTFSYDCQNVDSVRSFLATCQTKTGVPANLVSDWAGFECDVPGKGAAIAAMRSWRENLGWRELLREPAAN